MKLSEAQKKYVYHCKIEIDDDKNFIDLRELNFAEKAKLNKVQNEIDYNPELKKMMPSCIIDSSFEDDEGNPANGSDIVKMLEKSSSLLDDIINVWITKIPFLQRIKDKPEKLKKVLEEANAQK